MEQPSRLIPLDRPPSIPANATIEITFTNDVSVAGEVRVGERRVAQVTWSSAGRVRYVKPFDREGRPHGVEIEYDEAGSVSWCARWVRGKMHGPVIHLDGRGRPVTVSEFVRGRGVDIWTNCGRVTEIREMVDGVPGGLERWGDPTRPWCEGFFSTGRRHGVFREWDTATGELKAGFPRFFIADKRVSRRVYEAAQRRDAGLREYDPSEDPMVGATFHLLAGSPVINSGVTADAPAKDLDGDDRPAGAGVDIGADERL